MARWVHGVGGRILAAACEAAVEHQSASHRPVYRPPLLGRRVCVNCLVPGVAVDPGFADRGRIGDLTDREGAAMRILRGSRP